jgi:SAM-dependent methyltransferase
MTSRPIFSRVYAAVSPRLEAEGLGALRQELLAGAHGRVVEVGAGNGLNFAHYPPAVSEVVAVEPEARLRRLAVAAAARAPVPVTVQAGVAGALPLPDDAVDAAVLCGGCSVLTGHCTCSSTAWPTPQVCDSSSGSRTPPCGRCSPAGATPAPTPSRSSPRPGSRSPRCAG